MPDKEAEHKTGEHHGEDHKTPKKGKKDKLPTWAWVGAGGIVLAGLAYAIIKGRLTATAPATTTTAPAGDTTTTTTPASTTPATITIQEVPTENASQLAKLVAATNTNAAGLSALTKATTADSAKLAALEATLKRLNAKDGTTAVTPTETAPKKKTTTPIGTTAAKVAAAIQKFAPKATPGVTYESENQQLAALDAGEGTTGKTGSTTPITLAEIPARIKEAVTGKAKPTTHKIISHKATKVTTHLAAHGLSIHKAANNGVSADSLSLTPPGTIGPLGLPVIFGFGSGTVIPPTTDFATPPSVNQVAPTKKKAKKAANKPAITIDHAAKATRSATKASTKTLGAKNSTRTTAPRTSFGKERMF